MTQRAPIPVIDLFAGPGGLGEGFSSLADTEGARRFQLSAGIPVDADPAAEFKRLASNMPQEMLRQMLAQLIVRSAVPAPVSADAPV